MRIRNVLAGVVLAVGLAASIASGSSSVNNKPSGGGSSNNSSGNSGGGSTTTAAVAHVGDTITLSGEALTLQQVIDPAQGADQFSTPDPGKRFVGVELVIKNTGSATLDDDANNNVSVNGSDNQSYTSDLNNISECTNFNNGEYTLGAGESVTGCVAFQLPTGISVTKVEFNPTSGLSGNVAEWLVP